MDTPDISPAQDHEFGAVAGLRWRWAVENGATPAVTQDQFARDFQDWARERTRRLITAWLWPAARP
jgi:hypothetical protein